MEIEHRKRIAWPPAALNPDALGEKDWYAYWQTLDTMLYLDAQEGLWQRYEGEVLPPLWALVRHSFRNLPFGSP